MYRIGDFSKMSKTTIKTLRYYDEIGLLKPKETDSFTGYRMYSTSQLNDLHKIYALKQAGLMVEEIRSIINGADSNAILQKRKKEILEKLKETNNQLSALEFILNGKQEENTMNYVARIKEIPECIVYSIKMKVASYNDYFALVPPIGETILAKYPDLKCTVSEYCYLNYLDNEYKEKDFNVELCESVDKLKPDFDNVQFKKTDKITVASVMHKGPYSTIRSAYAYILKWVEENGYKQADVPRESVIDGIWNKDSEDEWLTEVQIPICK